MKSFTEWRDGLVAAFVIGAGLVPAIPTQADTAQGALACEIGSSSRWGSSWCDLSSSKDFPAGSTVEIAINSDGPRVVLIRFLAEGNDPNEPLGLVGGKHAVPTDGKIILKLDHAYKNIRQISIHGGSRAWEYDLGSNNKAAHISSILVRP